MALLFGFEDYGELNQAGAEDLLRPIMRELNKSLLDAWGEWKSGISSPSRTD